MRQCGRIEDAQLVKVVSKNQNQQRKCWIENFVLKPENEKSSSQCK